MPEANILESSIKRWEIAGKRRESETVRKNEMERERERERE